MPPSSTSSCPHECETALPTNSVEHRLAQVRGWSSGDAHLSSAALVLPKSRRRAKDRTARNHAVNIETAPSRSPESKPGWDEPSRPISLCVKLDVNLSTSRSWNFQSSVLRRTSNTRHIAAIFVCRPDLGLWGFLTARPAPQRIIALRSTSSISKGNTPKYSVASRLLSRWLSAPGSSSALSPEIDRSLRRAPNHPRVTLRLPPNPPDQ